MERVRQLTHSYDQHPPLQAFKRSDAVPAGVEVVRREGIVRAVVPETIPGMSAMRHRPPVTPPCVHSLRCYRFMS